MTEFLTSPPVDFDRNDTEDKTLPPLPRVQFLLVDLYDTSDCCIDCPDVNPFPPATSECPYFDDTEVVPICSRDGNSEDQIRRCFFVSLDEA